MHSIIILTGPSCAGKSPLVKTAKKMYPEVIPPLQSVVLFNSRRPRPGEQDGKDYHFRSRDEIEQMRGEERFRVMDVRGDLQALDIRELRESANTSDLLYEGNPHVAHIILKAAADFGISVRSVFLSPLSAEELSELESSSRISAPEVITEMMRRKLLRRTRSEKGELSLADLHTIERRARATYEEMKMAALFDSVLPNHDGEDSDHWSVLPVPIGDARAAVRTFVGLLAGKKPSGLEKWS